MSSPIFSNVESPINHAGSSSGQQVFFTSLVRSNKYLYREDLPLPVGILIESHTSAGSTQSIPGIVMTEGEQIELVTQISPLSTALREMLKAFPI